MIGIKYYAVCNLCSGEVSFTFEEYDEQTNLAEQALLLHHATDHPRRRARFRERCFEAIGLTPTIPKYNAMEDAPETGDWIMIHDEGRSFLASFQDHVYDGSPHGSYDAWGDEDGQLLILTDFEGWLPVDEVVGF